MTVVQNNTKKKKDRKKERKEISVNENEKGLNTEQRLNFGEQNKKKNKRTWEHDGKHGEKTRMNEPQVVPLVFVVVVVVAVAATNKRKQH